MRMIICNNDFWKYIDNLDLFPSESSAFADNSYVLSRGSSRHIIIATMRTACSRREVEATTSGSRGI